ncbi:MAG: NTP transferase domain-containing protein [Planctomycetota bacterium]|nr:NTP transferase domain-containing protein [Planctomycetota bacterium]
MLSVVVLAAGKGTRMRSDLPKVLHPLLGVPLLDYPLELAEELAEPEGDRRIAVVVGHGCELIQEAYRERRVVWALQEEQLGTGHAARIGVDGLWARGGDRRGDAESTRDAKSTWADADVLIFNGDLPLLRPATVRRLVDHHRRSGAEVTLLTVRKSDPRGFGRIVRAPGGGPVTRIVEEADADAETLAIREVNVGTYVFRVSTFRECFDRTSPDNRQGEYYLPDVAMCAADEGRLVETVLAEDEREAAQVNSRLELAEAAHVLRQRILEELMEAGVTIDDPRTTYIEKGVSIGRDSRIHPFTVIRRGVHIGPRCEVGPFAQLRPGSRLEKDVKVGNFVEIKNSTLGEGTKAAHLAYVGDGEVGRRVNLGAGTIFANYDGKTKSQTVIQDGAFIGSGTVLVAPVRVGRGAVTGAGAVVLRGHDVGDGEVVVGVPATPLTGGSSGKGEAGTGKASARRRGAAKDTGS